MFKLYDIAANEENLKHFNKNPFGKQFNTVDDMKEGLDSFEDKLNRILSEKIDSSMSAAGITTELGEILPSDRIFYKKVTSHILPDETDEETASGKILETFLLIKADRYYTPTSEQMEIMKKVLDFFSDNDEFLLYRDESL